MADLKPCPFCGGAAYFDRPGTRRQSCIVACSDCGARHESSDEDERSGESWNRRVPDGVAPAQEKQCHNCIHKDVPAASWPCRGCSTFEHWKAAAGVAPCDQEQPR